jgi:hypothetical protein
MEDDLEDSPRLDADADLLRELAHQAVFWRFVGFDLPPGKLPVTLEVRASLPPGCQDLSVALEDPRGDEDGVSHA